MTYGNPISGPSTSGEKRDFLLVGGRVCVTAAGLLLAGAVVLELGVLFLAAWALALVGAAAVTYLAFRRSEAVLGALLVTVLAAPLALLVAALSFSIEPLVLVAAGGWLYSKRGGRQEAESRHPESSAPDGARTMRS